jgi:hypothetical protein
MERFGSSKLRIVWACAALLLAGLVLGGVQGFGGPQGTDFRAFGTSFPLDAMGIVDPKDVFRGALTTAIYGVVPFTILFAAFQPVVEMLHSERWKGLLLGPLLGLLHGLFYSQVLILPLWALAFRTLGSFLPGSLALTDMNAVVLGFQLLLWSLALSLLLRSNRGLAILFAIGLRGLGGVLSWGGEFLGNPDLFAIPPFLVKTMAFLGHLLPTGQVPSDPFGWSALPLSIGGPWLLAGLLLLIPVRKGKRS